MMHNNLRILVISTFVPGNANVIRDFLFAFDRHSRHQYFYVFAPSMLNENLIKEDLENFDVIILFWSNYLIGSSFSKEIFESLNRSRALKVLFLQDEYRDVRLFNEVMVQIGVNLMFTCVAEADQHVFYPTSLIPSLRGVYSAFTGYVPTYLEKLEFDLDKPRYLDVIYRSRSVPYYLGDLGQEKVRIARAFKKISAQNGFSFDISVREDRRIYGDAWVKFCQSAYFTLGTGSGASVIDFTGDIRRNSDTYLRQNPQASYEDVRGRFFSDVDGKVVIDTISPRLFEAAACGNILVMHESPYAGIVQPDRHYILVKKDYSNIDEVVMRMRDRAFGRTLALNTYNDLIASKKYNYENFIKGFDDILAQHIVKNFFVAAAPKTKLNFYLNNYVRYKQGIIPVQTSGAFVVIPRPGLSSVKVSLTAIKHRFKNWYYYKIKVPIILRRQRFKNWRYYKVKVPLILLKQRFKNWRYYKLKVPLILSKQRYINWQVQHPPRSLGKFPNLMLEISKEFAKVWFKPKKLP